jgi:hypothetical protein
VPRNRQTGRTRRRPAEQDHGAGPAIGAGLCRRRVERIAERAAAAEVHPAFELIGKCLLGLTDQEGVGDAAKTGLQRLQAIRFVAPTGDPIDRAIAGQGTRRRIAIGRLAVVDELDAVDGRDVFHAVGQAGEAEQRPGDDFGIDSKRPRGGIGGRRVLPIVPAGQRHGGFQIAHRLAVILEQTAIGGDAVEKAAAGGDGHDV